MKQTGSRNARLSAFRACLARDHPLSALLSCMKVRGDSLWDILASEGCHVCPQSS